MLTKDIISGFNILTLAGLVIMAPHYRDKPHGTAGNALSIGLMASRARMASRGYCWR
jgi:hypothetical protein